MLFITLNLLNIMILDILLFKFNKYKYKNKQFFIRSSEIKSKTNSNHQV